MKKILLITMLLLNFSLSGCGNDYNNMKINDYVKLSKEEQTKVLEKIPFEQRSKFVKFISETQFQKQMNNSSGNTFDDNLTIGKLLEKQK